VFGGKEKWTGAVATNGKCFSHIMKKRI